MDSASNCAATARDPHNQAIYSVKRPTNIFDSDIESVNLMKTVFNDILDICGISAGKKCDPEASTMRQILMLTDGDTDGDSIAISVMCLLAKHCRPLVEAGMVGRILPPAYAIPVKKGQKKERIFVHTQREFFDYIMKKFVKDVKISFHGRELSKNELYELLSLNFVYDSKLDKLARRYCCDPRMIERIAWNYHGDSKDQKKSYWMKVMKEYSDIRVLVEHGMLILDGDVPGYDYMNLAFDEHFDRHIHRFKEYQANNRDIYGYNINGADGKSLYDVMSAMRKFIPDGVERFKGLGELDPSELKVHCMDPKTRTAVIMKFSDDPDKDIEKISVIMSTRQKYREARAALIRGMRADDLDIDT